MISSNIVLTREHLDTVLAHFSDAKLNELDKVMQPLRDIAGDVAVRQGPGDGDGADGGDELLAFEAGVDQRQARSSSPLRALGSPPGRAAEDPGTCEEGSRRIISGSAACARDAATAPEAAHAALRIEYEAVDDALRPGTRATVQELALPKRPRAFPLSEVKARCTFGTGRLTVTCRSLTARLGALTARRHPAYWRLLGARYRPRLQRRDHVRACLPHEIAHSQWRG